MKSLIIVAGPSGVGKNTLIDGVRKKIGEDQSANLRYLKKITTREKRPDDRDEEAVFVTNEEYNKMMDERKIAIPYELRQEKYGITLESLAELYKHPHIYAGGDFKLIKSLRDSLGFLNVTTVYVTADKDEIIGRLDKREDTLEQKARSIVSVSKHLEQYAKNKELFEYEIRNGNGKLEEATNELKMIVNGKTGGQY